MYTWQQKTNQKLPIIRLPIKYKKIYKSLPSDVNLSATGGVTHVEIHVYHFILKFPIKVSVGYVRATSSLMIFQPGMVVCSRWPSVLGYKPIVSKCLHLFAAAFRLQSHHQIKPFLFVVFFSNFELFVPTIRQVRVHLLVTIYSGISVFSCMHSTEMKRWNRRQPSGRCLGDGPNPLREDLATLVLKKNHWANYHC